MPPYRNGGGVPPEKKSGRHEETRAPDLYRVKDGPDQGLGIEELPEKLLQRCRGFRVADPLHGSGGNHAFTKHGYSYLSASTTSTRVACLAGISTAAVATAVNRSRMLEA